MLLLSSAEYESFTGVSAATYGAVVDTLIGAAELAAAGYVGVESLAAADYTEDHDGNGDRTLWLKNWPVNSITSVSFVDTNDTVTAYQSSTYKFEAEYGKLHKVSGATCDACWDEHTGRRLYAYGLNTEPCWPDGYQNVRVVYNAGYTAAPADLKQALATLVSGYLDTRRSDLISQTTVPMGAVTKSLATAIEQDAKLQLLFAKWRRLP